MSCSRSWVSAGWARYIDYPGARCDAGSSPAALIRPDGLTIVPPDGQAITEPMVQYARSDLAAGTPA